MLGIFGKCNAASAGVSDCCTVFSTTTNSESWSALVESMVTADGFVDRIGPISPEKNGFEKNNGVDACAVQSFIPGANKGKSTSQRRPRNVGNDKRSSLQTDASLVGLIGSAGNARQKPAKEGGAQSTRSALRSLIWLDRICGLREERYTSPRRNHRKMLSKSL